MRSLWTGSLSFGLLQVPVKMFSATRDTDLHFRQLDKTDKTPIRYERVNESTRKEVPWDRIVKGYEYKKGQFVVVDEEELKQAAPEQTQTIDLEAFVDRAGVDPIYFDKPYYLMPEKRAEKGYVLLREALRNAGKFGIARMVMRTKQYLAAVLPEGDALMLTLMRFADELVDPKEVGVQDIKTPKISAAELDMADKLLKAMSRKWDPNDYQDEFRGRLRELLEERASQGDTVSKIAPPKKHKVGGEVVDLVSILEQSLAHKGDKATVPKAAAKSEKSEKAPKARKSVSRRKVTGHR